MTLPDWCYTLHDSAFRWLMELRDAQFPGRFRFCREGNVFPIGPRSGLDASVLALKACHIVGALSRIPRDELQQWTDHIRSFQREKDPLPLGLARPSGWFIDPVFLKHADQRHGPFGRDLKTRRAVTRQACAALMSAGSSPPYPVQSIPSTATQVQRYMRSLDWTNNPWDAGSHVSHLVFFLKMNRDMFGMTDAYDALVPMILGHLDRLRSPNTGAWYLGNPNRTQKVNGAMKVLTAFAVLDRPVENPELLIDLCLSSEVLDDGCNNLDNLFVLHYCQKYTDYKREEIAAFCTRRLRSFESFLKPDGAFSFYPDRSQTAIYRVPIAKGLCESDVHGTVLFMWGLKMIADILGCADEVPWQMPLN